VDRALDYLALAVAGGIGVLLRAACTGLVLRAAGPATLWPQPVATLAVNVIGSFLFGAVFAVTAGRPEAAATWRPIILVGLLGGFTTYSSFSFQTVEMLINGRGLGAMTYLAASNLLALGAAWAGLRLASW